MDFELISSGQELIPSTCRDFDPKNIIVHFHRFHKIKYEVKILFYGNASFIKRLDRKDCFNARWDVRLLPRNYYTIILMAKFKLTKHSIL